MARLLAAGKTLEEIGQMYGYTRETIRRRLLAEGITASQPCSKCRKRRVHVRTGQTLCPPCRTITARVQRDANRILHFWERVDQSGGPDACWPWLGARFPSGYGHLAWGGRKNNISGSHRVAWSLANNEEIPRGKGKNCEYILHRCDSPPCCNPRHLYKGSPKDNMRDRDQSGNSRLGWRKKVCKRGHDRTDPANIYEYTIKSGPRKGKIQRFCRACGLAKDKAHYWANR